MTVSIFSLFLFDCEFHFTFNLICSRFTLFHVIIFHVIISLNFQISTSIACHFIISIHSLIDTSLHFRCIRSSLSNELRLFSYVIKVDRSKIRLFIITHVNFSLTLHTFTVSLLIICKDHHHSRCLAHFTTFFTSSRSQIINSFVKFQMKLKSFKTSILITDFQLRLTDHFQKFIIL